MKGLPPGAASLGDCKAAIVDCRRKDGELLSTDQTAVREPDTEKLGSLWEELRPKLVQLVRLLGIGAACADDVLQEVYLTACQKSPRALDAEDLRRWLIRVTVNRCRLEHRQKRRWQRIFQSLTRLFDRYSHNSAVTETACRNEEKERVRRALRSLDPSTRYLLVLRYFAELDSKEIGKVMGLPDATVRGRLRAARELLARKLSQAGYHYD